MKQYKLKDAERQKALEMAFPGFAKELQQACEDQFKDSFSGVEIPKWEDGWSISVKKTLIEESISYDPNAWNNYPEVTPPEGVMMRCIIKTPGRNLDGPEPELPKICARTSGVWDGRRWHFFGHGDLREGCTVEFRTWE